MVNSIWYAGLAAGVFLFIAVILFDVAVVTKWNFNFPTTNIRMNDHAYKFNTKYIEVRRLDRIVDLFVGKELFVETLKKNYSGPIDKNAKESLYNINYQSYRLLNFDSLFTILPPLNWLYSGFTEQAFTNKTESPFQGIDYYEIILIPPFWIGISIYVILTIFFLLIVLHNTHKISLDALTNSVFTKENAIRIRFIAIYTLLAEFVRIIIFYWINNSFANLNHFSFINANELVGFYGHFDLTWTDINCWLLFVGIILLLISATLQSGSFIKEENDLTV